MRRAVAFAIDAAAWIGVFVAVVEAVLPEVSSVTGGLVILAVLNGWLNYHALCEWRWGTTLGKRLVGVRVTRSDGRPVSLNRALVRNLIRPVDFLVGVFFMYASKRRRRIGDLMADTVVVRNA